MNSLYTTADQHKPSATHFQCTLNILHFERKTNERHLKITLNLGIQDTAKYFAITDLC